MAAVVVPENRYAKVQFRANLAKTGHNVRDGVIFEMQVLFEAFYMSVDFLDVDRLEVLVYLELSGKRDEPVETRIAQADLSRDHADTVPWNSISITQFRGFLQHEARLYVHAGAYE